MDFRLTEDQADLRDELRRALADRCDPDRRRSIIDQPGAVDRDLWQTLADTGVFALIRPEAEGGTGLGWADATVVFEELGRALVPGPLVATFLAASLLDGEVGDRAASGQAVVGAVPAAPDAGGLLVEHLDGLDHLVVVGADVVGLVDPASLAGDPVPRPLDPLTPVTVVAPVPGGDPVGSGEVATTWRARSGLLSAAVQVGLGAAAVAMGTEYAKQRHQFGRPIGSFQAVKHLLADAHVAVEMARTGVQAAGVAVDEAGDAGRAIASARSVASRAAHRATTTNIQVHGGMGYTWELDAHLLLKRVLVTDVAVGSVEDAVEVRADLIAPPG